jgi:opacity protein-like surface antigen
MPLPYPTLSRHPRAARAARAVLLAGAALFALSPARAQTSAPPTADDAVMPFSALWITTGKLLVDVNRLNARFTRTDLAATGKFTGFDALSNDGFVVGAGAYAPIGRVLLGGEFHYSDVGIETSTSGKTNQITTSYGIATVGYAVWTSWHWTVFPYVGAGMGKVTLSLKSRDGGPTVSSTTSPTFDEIVLSPGTESRIDGTYYLLQPGIGVDYLALKSSESHVGITLGLRMGTSISPNRTTWTYGGRDVFGAPDVGPVGTTARIIIGIGGFQMSR